MCVSEAFCQYISTSFILVLSGQAQSCFRFAGPRQRVVSHSHMMNGIRFCSKLTFIKKNYSCSKIVIYRLKGEGERLSPTSVSLMTISLPLFLFSISFSPCLSSMSIFNASPISLPPMFPLFPLPHTPQYLSLP